MALKKQDRSTRGRHVNSSLFAIVAEGFFSRLSFGVISFALPLYAYHLGLSILQIGFLVTLNEAAVLVLKPMMGWVADRYGLKRTYTTSIGLRSLVALLLAVTQSPWQLYGIKTVHGMSKAMRDPSSSALIAEQGGKKAIASAFAWYHTAKIVAGSLGKALAGLLLTVTASNFSLVFTFSFLLSVLPFYTVVKYVKNDKISPKESETSVSTVTEAEAEITNLETPTTPTHVSSFDKSRRAQIMSWMLVGEDVGTIIGPLLAGLLWNTWGLTVMLSGRVVLSIITEIYTTLLNRSLEKKNIRNKKSPLGTIQTK